MDENQSVVPKVGNIKLIINFKTENNIQEMKQNNFPVAIDTTQNRCNANNNEKNTNRSKGKKKKRIMKNCIALSVNLIEFHKKNKRVPVIGLPIMV